MRQKRKQERLRRMREEHRGLVGGSVPEGECGCLFNEMSGCTAVGGGLSGWLLQCATPSPVFVVNKITSLNITSLNISYFK